ncbi:MAG: shikimate kinase [Deltaproteobacteria bacterium]|uniref:Shikimate kinase n=1 Tax=Candidatus Desulfacyla euxinica TaxID=2841693 RepID=A0A8J6MYD1_9DELT|nr:shikimate kinase [Candidatus Desulfacyla euxinica]MBL7216289.1 shikimate kinase [Desulfobacteraceae bacterium]
MNIVLIGYRCSGKTTVGKLLGRELKREFLDTDRLIEEKTGLSIHSYVSRNGWRDFRRVEREVVEEVASKDNVVIATGGGVVIDQENVRNLRKNGWVAWLDTGASVIRERMKKEQRWGNFRPALTGLDPFKEIDTILHERMPAYESASDYRVDTDGQNPEEMAQAIMRALSQRYKNSDEGGF